MTHVAVPLLIVQLTLEVITNELFPPDARNPKEDVTVSVGVSGPFCVTVSVRVGAYPALIVTVALRGDDEVLFDVGLTVKVLPL